jgi:hypothetical protein
MSPIKAIIQDIHHKVALEETPVSFSKLDFKWLAQEIATELQAQQSSNQGFVEWTRLSYRFDVHIPDKNQRKRLSWR